MDAEAWAGSLYLGELYIPTLRSIPLADFATVLEGASDSLLADSREYFERIACPTLALFGEDDLNVPVEQSVALLQEYFEIGENDDLTIVIFPGAGHSLNDFMSVYWEALYAWLADLAASWDASGS